MSTYTRKYCEDGDGRFWPITHISAVRNDSGKNVETMIGELTAATGFTYVQLTENLTNVVCPVSLSDGQQHHVIYDNPGSTEYTVAVSTSYSTPDGNSIELTVPGGGYGEINYLMVGNKVFVRAI